MLYRSRRIYLVHWRHAVVLYVEKIRSHRCVAVPRGAARETAGVNEHIRSGLIDDTRLHYYRALILSIE